AENLLHPLRHFTFVDRRLHPGASQTEQLHGAAVPIQVVQDFCRRWETGRGPVIEERAAAELDEQKPGKAPGQGRAGTPSPPAGTVGHGRYLANMPYPDQNWK